MKIEHKQIKIGSRVRLLEDVEMFNHTYTKGHEFNVYGSSYRGWDLVDDDGNKIDECLFIHDKLELVEGRILDRVQARYASSCNQKTSRILFVLRKIFM